MERRNREGSEKSSMGESERERECIVFFTFPSCVKVVGSVRIL